MVIFEGSTVSLQISTTRCFRIKKCVARFAISIKLNLNLLSELITTTKQENFEVYCAGTAIWLSDGLARILIN